MIELLSAVPPPVAPAGHAIPVSEVVANLIRVILLMMEAALAGKIVFGLIDKRSYMHYLPWERRIAWLCVLTFVTRNLFAQIQMYGSAITWEGAPFTFLAVSLGLIAVRRVRVPVHIREPEPIPELSSRHVAHNRRSTDKQDNGNDGAARATAEPPAAR